MACGMMGACDYARQLLLSPKLENFVRRGVKIEAGQWMACDELEILVNPGHPVGQILNLDSVFFQ